MLPYGLHLLEGACSCGQVYVKRSIQQMKTQETPCQKCNSFVKLFKLKQWGRYANLMESGRAILIEGNEGCV